MRTLRSSVPGFLRFILPLVIIACGARFSAAAEPGQAAPATAPATAAAASTEAPAELYACRYGRSRFPEDYAFRDGHKGTNIDFAWSFYVARTGADITLIDTGFSDPATARQWGVMPTRLPEELLADLHIAPADVTRVIITHIHFDHLSNLPLFTRAQVVISRRDRDDYVSQKKLGGVTYDARIAAILGDPARTHVVDTREALPGGLEVEVVGSHTAGSAVVHVQHAGVHHVLAGDECYLCANRDQQRPIGRVADLRLNLAFLSRNADPAIVLLPSHDPAVFARFPQHSPGIARIFGAGEK